MYIVPDNDSLRSQLCRINADSAIIFTFSGSTPNGRLNTRQQFASIPNTISDIHLDLYDL